MRDASESGVSYFPPPPRAQQKIIATRRNGNAYEKRGSWFVGGTGTVDEVLVLARAFTAYNLAKQTSSPRLGWAACRVW